MSDKTQIWFSVRSVGRKGDAASHVINLSNVLYIEKGSQPDDESAVFVLTDGSRICSVDPPWKDLTKTLLRPSKKK